MIACGHDFADSAFVIQWHVLGMFVPSFFSGALIARFGPERIIGTGALLNLACIAVALSGLEVFQFAVALCLLGVGWNFMFIGGTTLLTECYEPAEKARVQGMNDLLMFTSVGISATFAGLLHAVLGWHLLNLMAVPALLLVLAVLVRRRRLPASAVA
jgi:MFS family permease